MIANIVAVIVVALVGILFAKTPIKYAPQTANTGAGTVVQVQGGNAFIKNENLQITLPLEMKFGVQNLRTLSKVLYSVKFMLPDGKEAFVPKLERNKQYILFYTNEDLSEIHVSENYSAVPDDSRVCWIVTLLCVPNASCENTLDLGARGIAGDDSCYEI